MSLELSKYLRYWGVAKNPRGGDKRPWGRNENGQLIPLSTTSRRGWMDYGMAVAVAKSIGPQAAIGACLHKNCGMVVIDMDEDYTADQMAMVEWMDSYAETSSSGLGTHIFAKANLDGGVRDAKTDIEIYGRDRFIIVTGNTINGWEKVEERQSKIDRVVAKLGGIKASAGVLAATGAISAPTAEVSEEEQRDALRKIWKSDKVKRLWSGEWQDYGYPSQSEADAALIEALCWATDNDACVAAVFRRSALGQREKAVVGNYVARTINSIRRRREAREGENAAIVADMMNAGYNAAPAVKKAESVSNDQTQALINRLMDQIEKLTRQVADLTRQLAEERAKPATQPEPPAPTSQPVPKEEPEAVGVPGLIRGGQIFWEMLSPGSEEPGSVNEEAAESGQPIVIDGIDQETGEILSVEQEEVPDQEETVAAIDLDKVQEPGLPPGLAGQVVADICKSLRGKTPVDFASGAVIAAVSGFAARSVESYSGPQYGITNHVVLCAPPGSGKNVAAVVTGLFSEIAPHAAMSASTVGGRASVTKLRAQVPAGLIHWSEIGTDLARLSQDQAGSVGLRQVIQMFDRSPMSAPEASLTVGGSVIPRHYYLSMVADTQPAYMDHLLSSDASGSGLLSRLTVINYTPDMQMIAGVGKAISESSMAAIRRVAAMPDRGAGSDNPSYERVRATPEGARLLGWHNELRGRQVGGYRRHERQALADACARLHARAERAATAIAVMNNPMTPVITEEIAIWAIKLINYHWLLMIDAVRDSDKSASTIAIETLHKCIHDACTNLDSQYRDPDSVIEGEGIVTGRTIQRIIAANPKMTRLLAKNGMDDRAAISRMMNIMIRDYGLLQKLSLGSDRSVICYRLTQPFKEGLYTK
nr:MAG TPA: hypothetical protein [Caudoviricetes sp.]